MARNLSDYWRIDKSRDRTGELASILDGATKAIELLGGKYEVNWSRQSGITPSRKLIELNGGLLDGFNAPIPGPAVDVVIGLAIREAGYKMWTEPLSSYHEWYNLSGEQQKELNNIHDILEYAYIGNRLRRISNTLWEYIMVARKAMYPQWREHAIKVLAHGGVNWDSVIGIWGAISLYGEDIPDNASPELAGAVAVLMQKTFNCIKEDDSKKRLDMAVDTWRWLQRLDITDTSEIEQEEKKEEPEEAQPEQIIEVRQLHEVAIRAAVSNIKNGSYNASSHNRMKASTSKQTQWIHRIFSQLDTIDARWRHGLDSGKLDGRSLSKVGAGKTTVFKFRDMKDRPSLAVVLLLDVSGSMDDHLIEVNKTACIFSEALKPLYPKIWHEVVTYNGNIYDALQLSRLASSTMKLSLENIWRHGGTPSGEAIASALLLLKRRREQRKMMIHFTDGAPDSMEPVKQALELCKKDNVDVLAISVGRKQQDLYGEGKVEVIRDVPELPNAMIKMMKRIHNRG